MTNSFLTTLFVTREDVLIQSNVLSQSNNISHILGISTNIHIFYYQLHFGLAEPQILENKSISACNWWAWKRKMIATFRLFLCFSSISLHLNLKLANIYLELHFWHVPKQLDAKLKNGVDENKNMYGVYFSLYFPFHIALALCTSAIFEHKNKQKHIPFCTLHHAMTIFLVLLIFLTKIFSFLLWIGTRDLWFYNGLNSLE